MTRARRIGWSVMIVVVIGTLAAGFGIVRRGFSARDEPSTLEKIVARIVRRAAMRAGGREARNPVAVSKEILAEARAHFADHCALCHGNDGSGNTAIGRSLYPRTPDMRLAATQQLTDGELFYIIENGVRLTGMPAWSGVDHADEDDSWKLVHFIRHLSDLTPFELEDMERLNPKSPAERHETSSAHHKQ